MSHSLSVVLPCHNEALAVAMVLEKLFESRERILEQKLVSDIEIIVVNDGSTDSSKEILSAYESQVQVLHHESRRGYGRALKTGFKETRGNLIAFYDLDGTCCPNDLIPMLQVATEENVGLVTGNRMTASSHMPRTRWIGNSFYRMVARFVLKQKVQDCCSGFRMFQAKYLKHYIDWLPDDLNFSLAMTVTHLRQGQSYRELPIRYGPRLGQSKLSIFSDGPLFLKTLFTYGYMPASRVNKLKSLSDFNESH